MSLVKIYVWYSTKAGICSPTDEDLQKASVFASVPEELDYADNTTANWKTKVHAVFDNGKTLDAYWGEHDTDYTLAWIGYNEYLSLAAMLTDYADHVTH